MRPQPIAASFAPGACLNEGRYRLEREINRGATAVVYAADDLQTKRKVALKVMHCPDQVPVKIVKREIALSSNLVHRNMVRLLDVFAERKAQLVIVWELIDGPDLLDLLNESGGCMSEGAAAYYFVQLLDAVLLMHVHGFCHRDIKPENALVERSTHRLKLIDFGLAKHLDSVATLGVGTPDYMPPEMLQHTRKPAAPSGKKQLANNVQEAQQPPYDARKVDAWAMGVLLYLLVSGRYPFEDPNRPNQLAQTMLNIMAGRRQALPTTVSASCADLIAALLRTDPNARAGLEELTSNAWLYQQAHAYAAQQGFPPPAGGPPPPHHARQSSSPAGPPAAEGAARQRPASRPHQRATTTTLPGAAGVGPSPMDEDVPGTTAAAGGTVSARAAAAPPAAAAEADAQQQCGPRGLSKLFAGFRRHLQ